MTEGVSICRRRECEQLSREAFAAIGRVRDHVEQARVIFGGQVAPQTLYAAAHDHQEIVEIMCDAARQLSDGLQTLGLPQRGLRGLAAFRFGMQPPRAPQRDADDDQEQQRRRQAEDQMARHGRKPFAPNRRAVDAGDDVDRKSLELAIADPPLDPIDLGSRNRLDHAFPTLRDRAVQTAPRFQSLPVAAPLRITSEKFTVRTDQRIEAAGAASDDRIELLEIAREDSGCDHAVERVIRRWADAGRERRRACRAWSGVE